MLEMTEELIKSVSFLSITPLIGLTIMYLVNHWGDTNLERLLISNFQKVKIYASLFFICSGIFTIFIIATSLLTVNNGEDVSADEITNEGLFEIGLILPNSALGMIVVIFSVVFCVFLLSLFIVWLVSIIFSIKPQYEIELDVKGDWFILKRTEKKGLLLKSEDNNYMIINDWNNKKITRKEVSLSKWQSFLYGKVNFWLGSILLIGLLVLLGWKSYPLDSSWKIIIFILFLILLTSLAQYWNYKRYYKKNFKT